MSLLFPVNVEPDDVPDISGLKYHSHYITASEELELAEMIDQGSWNCTWERRRQLFGGAYGQDEGLILEIPDWGISLAKRMFKEQLTDRPFDQMLVNEYLPGQGIAMHRDHKPFDRTIVSLSLLSSCVMDFRNPDSDERYSLLLERRSLLILSDDARYKWQHGIARRKNDRWHGVTIPRERRVSITFRTYK